MRLAVIWLALWLVPIQAFAQSIQILSAAETPAGVSISVKTDIQTPFEVMASIDLAGQADEDIYIGNSQRVTIGSSEHTFVVKAEQRGSKLPAGAYSAEVTFYPRWGAEKSPLATKSIKNVISVSRPITLRGSGQAASAVAQREAKQLWVMENTYMGQPFKLAEFEKRLGPSQAMMVSNRNGIIVAHYFPEADMTLFENTLKRTLVTFRSGKQSTL